MDTTAKHARVPAPEDKTPDSDVQVNKLNEQIADALIPYRHSVDDIGLTDAHDCMVSNIKAQLEFTQSLANELPIYTEIQFTASSVFGLMEGLMRQLDVLSVINNGLCQQLISEKRQLQAEIKKLKGDANG